MTRFNVDQWDSNRTIRENAIKMNLHYSYVADLAKKNGLKCVRQKSGPRNKRIYVERKEYMENSTRELKIHPLSEPIYAGQVVIHMDNNMVAQLGYEWKEDVPIQKGKYPSFIGMGEGSD